jgi:hypothetical protein
LLIKLLTLMSGLVNLQVAAPHNNNTYPPPPPTWPIQATNDSEPYPEGEGFNIQWLLFVLGFFFWVTSVVGCFLPLCRPAAKRFPTKSYKAGWIANMVLSAVCLVLSVMLIALYTRVLNMAYQESSSQYPYYYNG